MKDEKLRKYLGLEETSGELKNVSYSNNGFVKKVYKLINFVQKLSNRIGYSVSDYSNELEFNDVYNNYTPSIKDLYEKINILARDYTLLLNHLNLEIKNFPEERKIIKRSKYNGKEKVYL